LGEIVLSFSAARYNVVHIVL